MKTESIRFPNPDGLQLTGRLALPPGGKARHAALFAHCFTCTKNLPAIVHISRALTAKGFAVLSFDFAGLGESEGDFADSNFSNNVADLVAAGRRLEELVCAPEIIIGHSLGGASVMFAAHELPSLKGVVTIGAPYDPAHVTHLLKDGEEAIRRDGQAEVSIGGRPFVIKQQFLDNLREQHNFDAIHNLGKPLLVLHAPEDEIVSVENAARIYKAAQHPRSFIALDGADHLLTRKADSLYVAEVVAAWAARYLPEPGEEEPLETDLQTITRTEIEAFLTEIRAGGHPLVADEPKKDGGEDLGPSPYDLLTAALGACTGMTLRLYANHKGWPLEETRVHLRHGKDYAKDAQNTEDAEKQIEIIRRELELVGDLTDEQRARLVEIAEKCPVHRTLEARPEIRTTLRDS